MNKFTNDDLELIREVAISMQAACFSDGRESMLNRANHWQLIADKCNTETKPSNYDECEELQYEIKQLKGDLEIMRLQRDATHVSRCPKCSKTEST